MGQILRHYLDSSGTSINSRQWTFAKRLVFRLLMRPAALPPASDVSITSTNYILNVFESLLRTDTMAYSLLRFVADRNAEAVLLFFIVSGFCIRATSWKYNFWQRANVVHYACRRAAQDYSRLILLRSAIHMVWVLRWDRFRQFLSFNNAGRKHAVLADSCGLARCVVRTVRG